MYMYRYIYRYIYMYIYIYKESTHLTFSISTPQRLVIKRKLEIPQREKKMVSTRPNPRSHYESLKPPGGFGPNPPLHEVRV